MNKKTFLLGATLGLFCLTTNAQDLTGNTGRNRTKHSAPVDKKFTMNAGIKGGATFSSLSGDANEVNLADKSGIGYVGGIFFNSRFGKMREGDDLSGTGLFGVQLEFMYRQLCAKTKGSDDLKMGYFEVPIMAQLYPFYKNKGLNSLYVEAGVSIAGTVSKSPDMLTVEDRVSYKTGDLKGWDARIGVGLGYVIPRTGFGIGARYYIGTSELAKNFPIKFNTVEATVSYRFHILGNKIKK